MLSEVELLGWVADGYYVRSLTAVSVEGEMGYPVAVDPSSTAGVPTSTDESLVTGFSSRGFATLSVDISSRVSKNLRGPGKVKISAPYPQETFEWEFPSIPQTTAYQLWVRYTNPGGETPLGAMVISGEEFFNTRIVFLNCPPPHPCHAPLVSMSGVDIMSFRMVAGGGSIIALTLNTIQLNLVRHEPNTNLLCT